MKKKETTLPPTNLSKHLSAENRHYGFDSVMANYYTRFFGVPEINDSPIILNSDIAYPIDTPPTLTQFLSKLKSHTCNRKLEIHDLSKKRMMEIKTLLEIITCKPIEYNNKDHDFFDWYNYTEVCGNAKANKAYADMQYQFAITRKSKNRYDITILSEMRTQCEKIRSKLQQ